MATYNSETYCDRQTSYQGLFEHDRGDGSIIIKDNLITSAEIGQARARSELLKGGYAERWITLQTVHINGLKQNDIITVKGFNWIIKEISFNFNVPVLSVTIKGVRYE